VKDEVRASASLEDNPTMTLNSSSAFHHVRVVTSQTERVRELSSNVTWELAPAANGSFVKFLSCFGGSFTASGKLKHQCPVPTPVGFRLSPWCNPCGAPS